VTIARDPDATAVARRRRLRSAKVLRDGAVLYWWFELVLVGVFYAVYSAIRNSNKSDVAQARRNADSLIEVERFFGMYHEHRIQEWALHVKALIISANYFYGSMHFVVTIGIMVYLFRRWPDDYPLWRNTLAVTTFVALIGFTLWPLMPPRLLPHSSGYVDTLAKYPTLWTFNSGAVNQISNQFAAMPSVHCAWALWCACVLVPRVQHRWAKILAASYPVMTVTVIVVTGNHYILDAVGGFLVLLIGFVVARRLTRAGRGARPSPLPTG